MYFGASFSRYGFDFRPLFIQFFSQTALNDFQHSLNEANQVFEEIIRSYTFDQHHLYSSSFFSASDTPSNAFVPPMVLINYTPLAIYCNALLTAFNDLRLCCPLSAVKTTFSLELLSFRKINVDAIVPKKISLLFILTVIIIIIIIIIISSIQLIKKKNSREKEHTKIE